MKKHQKQWKKCIPFLLPGLLGVVIFILIPFLDVIRRSFTSVLSGEMTGIYNYRQVFTNQAFRLAAGNTVKFILVCLPLLIGISLLIAVLVSKQRHIQMLKAAYLLPMAVPAAAVVLVWKVLFDQEAMNSNAAFYILVLSYLWKNMGYTVILWLAGLSAIPESITEAARVDGAGEALCFFKVVLPNLKPVLFTITVLSFLNSFKVFREAYLVAGSYPHDSMYMLQHLFNNWFVHLELDKMAAAAVSMGVVLSVFIFILQALWEE